VSLDTAITIPRLVIAATGSGTGKTSITLGLTRALRARGLEVAVFKVGPDYLDPTYHSLASGRSCPNLDGWMMGREGVLRCFEGGTVGADIALIEGVMGLFDGAKASNDEGSTAEIARWLDAPVIACVDASGMARTVAAVAQGLRSFDPQLCLAAVVANRVGSRRHLELLDEALATLAPPLALAGGLPRQAAPSFPQRHLGLQTASRGVLPEGLVDAWGQAVAEWFDLDALLTIAASAGRLATAPSPTTATETLRRPFEIDASFELRGARPARRDAARILHVFEGGATQLGGLVRSSGDALISNGRLTPICRIGVAQDAAFHFYYRDNLELLRTAGAELVDFSPIDDAALPEVDGLLLGGGYPEVHAQALADNSSMRRAITEFHRAGGPIYAECGGLMYLCQAIVDTGGREHPMVGLVPARAKMHERLQALGYVEVTTITDSCLGAAGLTMRGHQFRYSELDGQAPATRYDMVRKRDGKHFSEGYGDGQLLASYAHLHWAQCPEAATGLVHSCLAYRRRKAADTHHPQVLS